MPCPGSICKIYDVCNVRLGRGEPPCSSDAVVATPSASDNSRYVTALEEDYHVLNRMGGALEGCRAELAIVIEHINAAK